MAKLTSLDHGSDKNSGEKPNLTIQVYTEEPAKLYRIPKKTDSMPIGQTQLDSITSYQQPSELQKHLIADLKSALNCTSAATSHKETAKKTQNCAEVNLRGFSEPPAVHIVNSRIFASHVRPPKPAKIAQERPLSYHGNEEVPDNKTNSEIDYSTAWEQPTVPIIYPGTFVRSQSLTSLKRNSNGWQISDAPETTV